MGVRPRHRSLGGIFGTVATVPYGPESPCRRIRFIIVVVFVFVIDSVLFWRARLHDHFDYDYDYRSAFALLNTNTNTNTNEGCDHFRLGMRMQPEGLPDNSPGQRPGFFMPTNGRSLKGCCKIFAFSGKDLNEQGTLESPQGMTLRSHGRKPVD
jgi:hypothetical protein